MTDRTGLFAGDDPFAIAQTLLSEAETTEVNDPNAIALSTVDPDGLPNARMVLLKEIEADAFVFYTNYQSGKAAALVDCDQASMLFPWNELDRQVSVSGAVEGVSEAESDAYFASRPRDSQLGAWASSQSQEIEHREALMQQLLDVSARFGEGEIPRPPHWGGYRLVPITWEFWQGGENRLHDRFRYTRADSESWRVTRLQP